MIAIILEIMYPSAVDFEYGDQQGRVRQRAPPGIAIQVKAVPGQHQEDVLVDHSLDASHGVRLAAAGLTVSKDPSTIFPMASTSTAASLTTAPTSNPISNITTTVILTSTLTSSIQGPTLDCTRAMCETQLSPDFLLKYQINVPSNTTIEICEKCTISMEAVYKGKAWVSLAFSTAGLMTGSEAVMQVFSVQMKQGNSVHPH